MKKMIKSMTPQRILYLYYVLQIFPEYLSAKKRNSNKRFPKVSFFDDNTTIDKIITENMSLARFGDGEIMWMCGEDLDSFQKKSEKFVEDLKRSFQCNNPNVLIGIPYGIFNSVGCNMYAKMYWAIIKVDFLEKLKAVVNYNKTYCNASITRPYIDYKKRAFSEQAFKNIKRIWNNRNIVIVEGEKTKLGLGNDLFDNVLSIKRILCPATDAYEKIEEIKCSIRENVDKGTMILGALGPTASILATQLAEEGYQFIDIGHIDVEYMWFLKKAILRVPIEGKYVNESGRKKCSSFYDNDKQYTESIIDRII